MLLALMTMAVASAFTQQIDTLGGVSQFSGGDETFKLNTFDVVTDVTIDEIEVYLDPWANNSEVTFVIYEEAPGMGQVWDLVWDSGRVAVSMGLGFKSSGNVGFALDAGTYYAIGVYVDDSCDYFRSDDPPSDLGYAVVDGSYWSWNGTVPGGPPDPVTNGMGSFDSAHYHHRITASVPEDLDGDGFHEIDDCDDTDAYIYPNAIELCDGLDNDCDGQVDDNVQYVDYFLDADGDGAGDAANVQSTCDGPPSGFVGNDLDCDDADPDTHPGAPELCDQLDNDCDGDVDEGLPMSDWWADADGDGYGDPGAVITTCDPTAPSGYADNDDDCDDTDDTVNPGAAEFCDGLDNDCNGQVDDNVAYRDVYADGDGDGYGAPDGDVLSICEPEAPDGYSETNDDCDDDNELVHPDAEELCDGIDNDCDGAIEEGGVDLDGDGSFACDDCDDDADDIFPGAEDDCNGVDNDCDGDIPTAKDCDPDVAEKLTASCACNQGNPGGGAYWIAAAGLLCLLRRRSAPRG